MAGPPRSGGRHGARRTARRHGAAADRHAPSAPPPARLCACHSPSPPPSQRAAEELRPRGPPSCPTLLVALCSSWRRRHARTGPWRRRRRAQPPLPSSLAPQCPLRRAGCLLHRCAPWPEEGRSRGRLQGAGGSSRIHRRSLAAPPAAAVASRDWGGGTPRRRGREDGRPAGMRRRGARPGAIRMVHVRAGLAVHVDGQSRSRAFWTSNGSLK